MQDPVFTGDNQRGVHKQGNGAVVFSCNSVLSQCSPLQRVLAFSPLGSVHRDCVMCLKVLGIEQPGLQRSAQV